MKTKRAYLTQPGQFEIREEEISFNQDEVLVKVEVCGLCNWELNHWKGHLGTFPQSLGHEWAGEVIEAGPLVKGLKAGDKVTVLPDRLEGFSEYAAVREQDCAKLDSRLNMKQALGEPLKCIVTVLKAVRPEPGDCGVVIGCGPMGLWCVQALAGRFLSSLIAVDVDEDKLVLAKKFGATHVINPRTCEAAQAISDISGGRMADFVIEGTGNPNILNQSVHYLKETGRGRLILMSSHESTSKEFDFRPAIDRAIDIRIPHPKHSYNQMEDLERAVSMLQNGSFRMEEIITHSFSLAQIGEAFATLEKKPAGYIKGIVLPWA